MASSAGDNARRDGWTGGARAPYPSRWEIILSCYVTSNPLLDGTTPPGPGAGSPLIAAGDAALVTTYDFFGLKRNGRADIGAVEGP